MRDDTCGNTATIDPLPAPTGTGSDILVLSNRRQVPDLSERENSPSIERSKCRPCRQFPQPRVVVVTVDRDMLRGEYVDEFPLRPRRK